MKKVQLAELFSFSLLLNLPQPWRFLDTGQLSWAINITVPTAVHTFTCWNKFTEKITFTCPLVCFCWAVIQNCGKHLLEDGAQGESAPCSVEGGWVQLTTTLFVCCQFCEFYTVACGGDVLVLMGLCVCAGVWRQSGGYEFHRVAQGISLAPANAESAWASTGLAAGEVLWDYNINLSFVDRSEPSKTECLRLDLLWYELFMRRRSCAAWLAGLRMEGNCVIEVH